MRWVDRTTRLAALSLMLAVSVMLAGCGALTDKAAGTYNGAPDSMTDHRLADPAADADHH